MINALSHSKADESEADLILLTAHKSKGREWSGVMLDDDFFEPYLVPADERLRNSKRMKPSPVSGPVDNKIYNYSQRRGTIALCCLYSGNRRTSNSALVRSFFRYPANCQ